MKIVMTQTAIDAVLVLLVSSGACALIVFYGHAVWLSDSHTFASYAYDFLHGNWNPHLQWRSPGYPLILIATGVLAGSLAGLIAAQAAAGAIIPVLIYLVVLPAHRGAALFVSFVAIASGICYTFVTTVYPIEFYTFGLVFVTFLLVRWIVGPGSSSPWPLYALSLTCLLLASIRPIAYLIALVSLVIVTLPRRHLLHVILAAALFLAITISFAVYRHSKAGAAASAGVGAMVFFDVYLTSGGLDEDEPRVMMLRQKLIDFFQKNPNAERDIFRPGLAKQSEETYANLFDRYEGRPTEQVDAMLRHPHVAYYWQIVSILSMVGDEDLLVWVSLEQWIRHPLTHLGGLLISYRGFVVGPGWVFNEDVRTSNAPLYYPLFPQFSDPDPSYAPLSSFWACRDCTTNGPRARRQ